MTYKEFAASNPEVIDLKSGYTEYLVYRFKNISKYLTYEIPMREDRFEFEEENSILLEDMACFMEQLIHTIENR